MSPQNKEIKEITKAIKKQELEYTKKAVELLTKDELNPLDLVYLKQSSKELSKIIFSNAIDKKDKFSKEEMLNTSIQIIFNHLGYFDYISHILKIKDDKYIYDINFKSHPLSKRILILEDSFLELSKNEKLIFFLNGFTMVFPKYSVTPLMKMNLPACLANFFLEEYNISLPLLKEIINPDNGILFELKKYLSLNGVLNLRKDILDIAKTRDEFFMFK